jgi:tyrosyl-tRNA synthetase
MDIQTKIDLVTRAPTAEVVTTEELRPLFETKAHPVHYLGLEISGMLHLGSLLMNGYKFRDLMEAGCSCQVYLADWHAFINNKLGGDWDCLKRASDYYEEAFKFFAPGVKCVRGSELYHGNDDYWRNVITFSKHVTLNRATRCLEIMGRTSRDAQDVAKYFYPSMQAVDIRTLGADICHAGTDQRKVHMLAREVYPLMGWEKPVALHHCILPGLLEPEKTLAEEGQTEKEAKTMAAKMSKSKPDTAIFIHDSTEAIKKKISKAYCPPTVEDNPILALAKSIVFREQKEFSISRPAKFGGDATFASYSEVEKAYAGGKLHAADLKGGVAEAIDRAIAPVRAHFERRKELLEVYGEVKITR